MTTFEAGDYEGVVTGQGFGAAATGTPFLYLRVRVTGRVVGGGRTGPCPQLERDVRWYLTDHQVGARILREDLAVLGVSIADMMRLDLQDPEPITLIDRRIRLTCSHEVYRGEDREKWQVARPRAQVDPASLRAVAARFAALASRAPASPPPPVATTPVVGGDTSTDPSTPAN